MRGSLDAWFFGCVVLWMRGSLDATFVLNERCEAPEHGSTTSGIDWIGAVRRGESHVSFQQSEKYSQFYPIELNFRSAAVESRLNR